MAYKRKIKITSTDSTAVDINKIKILNDGAVVDIKKSLYCDSNLNLIEIYNINPYYTVSFKYIKDNESTPTTIYTLILEEGKTIPTVPTAPNMVGWIFSHWLLGEEVYTETKIKSTTVDRDLTFIAYYTPKTFTVDYYNNQEFLVQKRVNYNDRPITDITTLGVTPTSPEIGYTKEFIGWSLSNNNEPFDFTNYQTKGHLVLYACFSKTPINYTIIFDYDTPYDGRIEITRVSNVKIGDNIYNIKPTRPVRYLLGKTSSRHYSNDFSYYKGTTKKPLNDSKTLTSTIISHYADDKTIKLSLNYFEQLYPEFIKQSYNGISKDIYGNPITYYNGKFIVGGYEKIYYSESTANKPSTWVTVSIAELAFNGRHPSVIGFAQSKNLLIAYCSDEFIYYSYDGIEWYRYPYAFSGTSKITKVISYIHDSQGYGSDITYFVLLNERGEIWRSFVPTSPNASAWQKITTVGAGFTYGDSNGEKAVTLTVTSNEKFIVGTNKNTSYLFDNNTWTKLPNIPSDITSDSSFLLTIKDNTELGNVLWLKNGGRVFKLITTDNWEELPQINEHELSKMYNGIIYSNGRYFSISDWSIDSTSNLYYHWVPSYLDSTNMFTSIASSSNYVVALSTDTTDPTYKRIFIAEWKSTDRLPIYTLSFNSDGGSSIEPIINVNKIPQSLPVPTKAGYTFLGWQFYDETYGYWDARAGDDIFADRTLYAKWKPNT